MTTLYPGRDFTINEEAGTWSYSEPEDQIETYLLYRPETEPEPDILDRIQPVVNVLFWITVVGLPWYLVCHVVLAVLRGWL